MAAPSGFAARPLAFVAVASRGFVIQMAIVAALTRATSIPAEAATAIGVELAILHNFLWHESWTWRDRIAAGRLCRFLAYQLATGSISLAGNVLVVGIAVRAYAVDPAAANLLAVAIMSVGNFLAADRWVFARGAAALALASLPATARAAGGPSPETVHAWDAHIAGVERAQREAQPQPPPIDAGEMRGRELRIPGGMIHEWSGSVLIRGIGVRELIDALTTPGTPPPQDDVLESRVLAKSGDALRVFLKLRRTAVVTVTYDTEHEVIFTRHTPAFASSRSVATSIREAGGGDRGFLWRLNSYWTYRAVAGGVRVEVRSVSLSRDAPALVRPVALPVASRIARESMRRTLDAIRQFGESLAARLPRERDGFSRRRESTRRHESHPVQSGSVFFVEFRAFVMIRHTATWKATV